MDSKQVTGLITWTAVPWVLSRVKASHRVRVFGLRSCCRLERNCGFGSVLCTSGFSSKAKVGTLLCFKTWVQCPNPCPDYILLPKGRSFFPSRPQPNVYAPSLTLHLAVMTLPGESDFVCFHD